MKKRMIRFISILIIGITASAAFTQCCEESLKDVRIQKLKFAVQCWTFRMMTFEEALDKIEALGIKYVEAYPGQPLSSSMPDARFEPDQLTDGQIAWIKNALDERNLELVTFGVCNWENTEEAARVYFDFAKKLGIRTLNIEPPYDDYPIIERLVREYDIHIAIHNHPKPSKYWNPETVMQNLKGFDPRMGSGADTGHWMRSGIDPVKALQSFHGRITNVHLKDLNTFGDRDAYDVPFGSGAGQIREILAVLTLQDYDGFIAIEHEREKDLPDPSEEIRAGLDYIRSITYFQDYRQLLGKRDGRYSKHGWNQYGPGYFVLDEETGVLKGQGGMGLFWYARQQFGDFVLELDFKCSEHITNSGIFLRVPDMPVSDDYIYQSYEIQIDNNSKDQGGIHQTGAVYDAVAPSEKAFREAGQWNHYKITFKSMHLTVELNGVQVVDWKAEPRGKVKSVAEKGYIGLQNHDSRSPIYFKNIYIKEL